MDEMFHILEGVVVHSAALLVEGVHKSFKTFKVARENWSIRFEEGTGSRLKAFKDVVYTHALGNFEAEVELCFV